MAFRLTGAQNAGAGGDPRRPGVRPPDDPAPAGDVGAGKTVVALLAMIDVAAAGLQSVLMAPTEILARQHFETLQGPLAARGVKSVLLTGRSKGAERERLLADLEAGAAQVAVGTHALFQDAVAFKGLGLTVIDEQHRFGVSVLRERLRAKSEAAHLVGDVGHADPPRTLELTLYGDLDVSNPGEETSWQNPGRHFARRPGCPGWARWVDRLRRVIADYASGLLDLSPGRRIRAAGRRRGGGARFAALAEAFGDKVGLVHGQPGYRRKATP